MAGAVLLRPNEWLVPRRVVCTAFWCGVILIFTSIILLVTSRHKGRLYQSWGSVFLGCGCCLLLICLLLCLHAYFVMSAAVGKSRVADLLGEESLSPMKNDNETTLTSGWISISGTDYDEKNVSRSFKVAPNGHNNGDVRHGDVRHPAGYYEPASTDHSTLYMNHCNTASSSYFIKPIHETNGYHQLNHTATSPDARCYGHSVDDGDVNVQTTRSPPLCRVKVLAGAPPVAHGNAASSSSQRNNYYCPRRINDIPCDLVTSLDRHRPHGDVSHESESHVTQQLGHVHEV